MDIIGILNHYNNVADDIDTVNRKFTANKSAENLIIFKFNNQY